ncbi:MAG: chemotaxis protein CheD [Leptospirales bacterium]|jgi:chemotaxis protein CheD
MHQGSSQAPAEPANFANDTFGARPPETATHGSKNALDPFFKGKLIHVGVAEWRVARSPDALRTTLGSCVGVVLYCEKNRMGGMCHVLLGSAPAGKIVNKGKYARPAVLALAAELEREGIHPTDLRARIFGGASMFEAGQSSFIQQIGPSNAKAVKDTLAEVQIPIVTEDLGGTSGRTITVFLDDGRILLRSNGKEKYIYKT